MEKKLILLLFLVSFIFITRDVSSQNHYRDHVDIFTNQAYRGDNYDYIIMKRSGNRIKAKYFAQNFTSVENDFRQFAGNNKIVCYAAAGYLTGNYNQVENLTIVNGRILERNIQSNKFDALVIIYPNGGIAVSNLREGNLRVVGGGAPARELDIRNNSWDRQIFYNWCESERATVFQTHLFAFDNTFIVPANADSRSANAGPRLRRFLIVGRDNAGNVKHIIINSRKDVLLRAGAEMCFNFAQNMLGLNVAFMINLDTGAQNVFGVFNSDGSKFRGIKEDYQSQHISSAHNLLVYYFE